MPTSSYITATGTDIVKFNVQKDTAMPTGSLIGWWKSDVGLTFGVSPKISQWADQSGNGNHLTNATVATQPTTGTTLNGLVTVNFQNTWVLNATFSQTYKTPCTLYYVGQAPGYSPGGTWYLYQTQSFSLRDANGVIAGYTTKYTTSAITFNTTFHCLGTEYNPVYSPITETGLSLGGNFNNVTTAGNICEIIYYRKVHNSDEKLAVVNYLMTKWGLS